MRNVSVRADYFATWESEGIRDQPLAALPAWAFAEILREAASRRSRSKKRTLARAFPPGTPLVDIVVSFHHYKHVLVEQALGVVFQGWERSFLGQNPNDALPRPRYSYFEIDPKKKKLVLEEAALTLTSTDGTRLVAYLRVEGGPAHDRPKSVLQLTCPAQHSQRAIEKSAEIERWVEQHDYLKGKKLDAQGRFISQPRSYDWDCVFAPPALLAAIRRNTQGFLEKLDHYRRLHLPTRRGVLLHGKPGTGKTLIGKVLCSQLRETFIWVRPGDVWHPARIAEIFEMARDLKPSLIFFEDLDLSGGRRNHLAVGRHALGELMNQLDGLEENNDIVVVATTNDLEMIEPAIKDRPSRFDCVIEIPDIDDDIRHRYLRAFLDQRGLNPTLFPDLDAATRNCSTIAEVQEQAIRCLQRAIECGADPATLQSFAELPPIQQPPETSPKPTPIGFTIDQT